MSPKDDKWSFRYLLDCCSDVHSDCWEEGWRRFLERFLPYINAKIKDCCYSWNVPRLKLQITEVVETISYDVLKKLYKDDCKALRDFRNPDNEKVFLYWISTICNNTTGNFIKKHIRKILVDTEVGCFEYLGKMYQEQRWELFENIVKNLRKPESQRGNLERDINICLLRWFAEFSTTMVLIHPCFKNINAHTIENIIYRMKKNLNIKDFKNNL